MDKRDHKQRHEAGLKTRREVLGDAHVDRANAKGFAFEYMTSGRAVVLGDLVIDPTAAPRPLPIIEAAEAPLWRDRVRANEYWYAPTFELVRPDPARPAETGPFRFVFERTGVTAAGAPALTGDVLFTLRPVMRAETRAELDARGDPTARSVPRDGLGAVLEIPFVDDRDGSLKRHAFPADVDFVTSPGHRYRGRPRAELGLPGAGPVRVITDYGILDADAGELVLTVNCTFSPPTSNGSVPSSGFTCMVA